MLKAVAELPDDPAILKQIIAQRDGAIAQRDASLAQRIAQIEQIKREAAEQLQAMQERHQAEMAAILRRFYGPHNERFDPAQLLLFGLKVAQEIAVDEKTVEAESGEKLKTRRISHHKHGRRELPASLPRRPIVHDLCDEEKPCPCCGGVRACIGHEISEQLEFIPAKVEVLQHIRRKYACKTCGDGSCAKCDGSSHIQIAIKEAQPIEKGLPGPGLLAHLLVSKLGDHLPLYRLEKIFDRSGIDIARSTMCAWMLACGQLIKPLVELMAKRVKQSDVVHTDDTRVPVRDETIKGKCKSGRIWTYIGDEDHPDIIYEYTPDHTRAGPQKFLDDFKGYLQADAYGGYDGVYTKGLVHEVACWAHARRKFFDAQETDGKRSTQMLRFVQLLYAIENRIKQRLAKRLKNNLTMTAEERHQIIRAARQSRSKPILAKIKQWLDTEKERVLPRSPMAQAIGYTLNQWEALCRFTEQGFLNIDNNAAERALKRVAIGRKNWLFAGNYNAAASHARLWTLIASAERHGLNPQTYLMSVLAKIGQTPLSELNQFLPDHWKADHASEQTTRAPGTVSQTASPV